MNPAGQSDRGPCIHLVVFFWISGPECKQNSTLGSLLEQRDKIIISKSKVEQGF